MEVILGCGAQVRVRKDNNRFIAEEVLFQQGEELHDPIGKPVDSVEALLSVLCLFALTTYEQLSVSEMQQVISETAATLREYHELNCEYLSNLEQGH